MATFKKKILLSIPLLLGFLLSLQQAFAQAFADKIPEDAIPFITIITAPWPEYTFGLLYFFILIASILGILIHVALQKTKIFGEEFGGGKKAMNIAVSVLMTLIVIKFMPFTYYFGLLLLLIVLVTVVGFLTFAKALTSFTETTDRANALIIGVMLVIVAFITQYIAVTIEEYEMVTLGVTATTFAWISGILGVIISIIGGILLFKPSGAAAGTLRGTFGGERGVRATEAHEVADVIREQRFVNEQVRTDSRIARLLREARAAIPHNLDVAEERLREIERFVEERLTWARRERATARDLMRRAERLHRDGHITDTHFREMEGAVARLANYIERLERHEASELIAEDRGLRRLINLLRHPRGANWENEARAEMARLVHEFAAIEHDDMQLERALAEMRRFVDAISHHGPVPIAAPGAPPGAPAAPVIPPPPGI